MNFMKLTLNLLLNKINNNQANDKGRHKSEIGLKTNL